MQRIDAPSPNHDSRNGQTVDMLVMHYTGMDSAQAALAKLCDPAEAHRVSAHYLVDEAGRVFALVPEDRRAWHAGVSSWRGNKDINARSIGIEIANPGHDGNCPAFPKPQMEAVAELAKGIIARHGIPAWNVVAHSDIAPARKQDPGEHFDWKSLADQGIGLWHAPEGDQGLLHDPLGWARRMVQHGIMALTSFAGESADIRAMQKSLARFGYDVPTDGVYDTTTRLAATAFQRHFRQHMVNGAWDDECRQLLNGLLARVPSATVAGPDGRMAARS